MKPPVLVASCMVLLWSASLAQGQGIRGFAGGGGRSGISGQSAGPVISAPQAPSAPRGFTSSTPSSSSPNPSLSPQSMPQTSVSRGEPQQSQHRSGVIGAPPRVTQPQPLIVGKSPHPPHRQRFFHHHPGVVILDVTDGFGGTVITQVAPGVIQAEPRYTEDSPNETRTRESGQLAPFDPAPHEVVDRMLALAKVKKSDVVYDLGAGDGRIVIAAAKKYGVRGVGFEIDPGLVKLARENARRAGVDKLVEIRQEDFLTADLSPASVVTLYLSYDGNLAVRPQLMRQLKRDARVVSYTFDMADWQPKVAETLRDSEGNSHELYLWQIGEPMVFSDNRTEMLRPQPNRRGPLIIEVR
jgi:precorrin-6B methylase 2